MHRTLSDQWPHLTKRIGESGSIRDNCRRVISFWAASSSPSTFIALFRNTEVGHPVPLRLSSRMRRLGRTDCYQPGDDISNAFALNPELFDWLTTGLSKGRSMNGCPAIHLPFLKLKDPYRNSQCGNLRDYPRIWVCTH